MLHFIYRAIINKSMGVSMNKPKWIFFDVGSTLVDETEAYNHRIREMISGTDITFEAFDKVRIELAIQGYDGNSKAIKHFGLKKTPWHSEDETPYTDVIETLSYLSNKGYKLGIIANQSLGTADRLKNWGLLDYFDKVVASAEVGVSKPDKAIFEIAFMVANCKPEESMMVGDRLDNDIIPAKSVGMKTVWIRKGLSQYQDPVLGKNIADYQIDNLNELLNIL